MLSMIGLIGGLLLLIVLTLRGVNLFIGAPLCAMVVALCGGLPLFSGEENFVSLYMAGFAGFVAAWFFMFLLGSLFGKFMEDTGAADSLARWISARLGRRHAVLAVVLCCAVLTYGGVSVFVVAFSVFPIALSLFKDANLPRRFIPAALAFGSVTFTMTSAGSPEIQNWIPIQYLGTSPYAGWEVSLLVAVLMAIAGYTWLKWLINRAVDAGERFDQRDGDPGLTDRTLPSPVSGLLPLLVVLGLSFTFHDTLAQNALIVALAGGVAAIGLINIRHFQDIHGAIGEATTGALIAIGNTSAVVGFGSIAKVTPAFTAAVAAITGLPGNELVGAAVAVSVIAGLTGSASGGLAIALPEISDHFLDRGVNPEQLHRISSISSGALDSLPHNGYVVTTIRAICKESHRSAYGPIAAVTVVVPLIGLAIAVGLFVLM
ncbi:GntP family permease [Gilvimarinus sp. F26214L]|uniref:GntP family permease n=1 Tax=Gilvimarinus sp. DZF01 TaxID=3461371 RepID=UPI0040467EAF